MFARCEDFWRRGAPVLGRSIVRSPASHYWRRLEVPGLLRPGTVALRGCGSAALRLSRLCGLIRIESNSCLGRSTPLHLRFIRVHPWSRLCLRPDFFLFPRTRQPKCGEFQNPKNKFKYFFTFVTRVTWFVTLYIVEKCCLVTWSQVARLQG